MVILFVIFTKFSTSGDYYKCMFFSLDLQQLVALSYRRHKPHYILIDIAIGFFSAKGL